MRRNIVTAVILALGVNAGVLLALPLLGSALETALPAHALLDVRDVELIQVRETPPVPLVRELVPEDAVQVNPPSQPPTPQPEAPPAEPERAPGEALPDLLRDIDFNLDPDALRPAADLVLPGTAGSGGGAGSGTGGAGQAAPEERIWSLDEVDRLPVKIRHVQPAYPGWALEQGVESEVTLSLTIGAHGGVSDVRVEQSSGYRDFDQAAVAAVSQWQFAPALAADKAIAVRAMQRIRFSLR